MQQMKKIQPHDSYAALLGVQIKQNSFENTVVELNIRPEFTNAMGTVHGGVIFSLADIAFAAACNSTDHQYIGVQTEIRYMHQAQGKLLQAQTLLISSSKKFAHIQVMISDELNTQVALFNGTAYQLGLKK